MLFREHNAMALLAAGFMIITCLFSEIESNEEGSSEKSSNNQFPSESVATEEWKDDMDSLPCQHVESLSNRYPPKVFHQSVEPVELNKYDEILVIGDIHGFFDELKLLLKRSNATSDNVLKIITGDLTRGGYKSIDVLRFVRDDPSILSVRGNNDERTLIHYHRYRRSQELLDMDSWMKSLLPEDVSFLEDLPYTISIPSLNFAIMHAGLVPGIPLNQNKPYDIMNIRTLVSAPHCPSGYAPTRNVTEEGEPWAKIWNGPQMVIFGHDHNRMLQIHPMAVGIDTGCEHGGYMTGLFIYGNRSGQFVNQHSLLRNLLRRKPKRIIPKTNLNQV